MNSDPRRKQPGPAVGRRRKTLLTLLAFLVLAALAVAGWYYWRITRPVTDLKGKKSLFLYIRTGSDFNAVMDSLTRPGILTSPGDFAWLADLKGYPQRVRPGRYRIVDRMPNNALVNLLRSGMQEPVMITIQNVTRPGDLAGRIGRRLETDSARLAALFRDYRFLSDYGVTPSTLFTLFIADTYEFYWNTSPQQLFERMKKEHDRFWNDDRKQLAAARGLSVAGVVTLASIVEKESNKNDERPVIAGVYLNRLRLGMALQADPTVVFAWNVAGIRRVTGRHTQIDSPYNTYLHPGLPPGPICLPGISSIEAVLHAEKHDYLYFCAREDLSGYHRFAATLDEHNRNARRYQKALDKLRIH